MLQIILQLHNRFPQTLPLLTPISDHCLHLPLKVSNPTNILLNLLCEVISIIGKTAHSTLIISSNLHNILFVLSVLVSQTLQHPVFHSHDLIQSLSLVLKSRHHLPQLLSLSQTLTRTNILQLL